MLFRHKIQGYKMRFRAGDKSIVFNYDLETTEESVIESLKKTGEFISGNIFIVEKEEKKVVVESEEKVEKDDDLELAQKMYEEKIGKLPPNKKNDKDRLLSKLAE